LAARRETGLPPHACNHDHHKNSTSNLDGGITTSSERSDKALLYSGFDWFGE
jgi:hypothetical protein